MQNIPMILKAFSCRRSSGYTLIELAVVVAVTGLVLQGAAVAWRVYAQDRAAKTSVQSLDAVASALDRYVAQAGHYPCPARLDTPRAESQDYGVPIQCDSSVAGYNGPANPGDYENGIYVQVRTLTGPDGTMGTIDDIQARVYRGMVPFRLLNLLESEAYDGYHARLHYVVTEILTRVNDYEDTGGAIEITDDTTGANPLFGVAVGNPGARYLVFSTGPDKKGAWNMNGRMILPCDDPSSAAAAKDAVNCWNTQTATYKSGPMAEGDGADHFDDSLRYYSSNNSIIWKARSENGAVMSDVLNAQTSTSGVLGIGNKPSKYAVEVVGQARVQSGIHSSQICNVGSYTSWGGNCFLPQKISIGAGTGTVAGSTYSSEEMHCPNPWYSGAYVNAIQGDNQRGAPPGGAVICSNLVAPAVCPSGEYIYSIEGGKILCSPLNPPCQERVVTVCAGQSPVTIPASDSGDYMLRPGTSINTSGWIWNGASYIAQEPSALWFGAQGNDLTPGKTGDYDRTNWYQCIGGSWKNKGYVGRCETCDPIAVQHHPVAGEDPILCSDWFNGGGGENDDPWQDTWGIPETYTGYVSAWDWSRTCNIYGYEEDHWINVTNNCVCQDFSFVDTYDCTWNGPGWTGTVTTTYTWTCDTPMHGEWYPTEVGECIENAFCEPQDNRVTESACPVGYSGTMITTEVWDCALGDGYGDWVTPPTVNMGGCVCDPGVDGPYPAPCQPGHTGQATRTRTINCDSGSPVLSPWTYDYDGCTCNSDATQQVTVTACQNAPGYGAGYIGNVITTTTFNCDNFTWDPPVTTAECQTGGYTWSSGGTPSPQPQQTNPGYPMVGSICTTPGVSGYYCQKLQAGGYITYPDCQCN